jgi:hypothetical protein
MQGRTQQLRVFVFLCGILLLLAISSCQHDRDDSAIPDVKTANATPIASIVGNDRKASLGSLVIVSGADSSDLEQQPLNYVWNVIDPDNEAYPLENPGAEQITVIPTKKGEYKVTLKVSDGIDESDEDLVHIIADNNLPVAKPAYLGKVEAGSTITLDASQSSAEDEGQALTYLWEFMIKPKSSQADFSDPTVQQPTLYLDVAGIYGIHLTVSDGYERSHIAMLVLDTNSTGEKKPIADAGRDIILISTSTPYTIDGSGSSDPKLLPLEFQWEIINKPPQSNASIVDFRNPVTELNLDKRGSYVLQLSVTNSEGQSDKDTVVITDKRQGLFCADCHNIDQAGGPKDHPMQIENVYSDCGRCHRLNSWQVGPAVPGSEFHRTLTRSTHPVFSGLIGDHKGIVSRCSECHLADKDAVILTHPKSSNRCNACHATQTWFSNQHVEHSKALGACKDCHGTQKSVTHIPTTADCSLCHTKIDWKTTHQDPHTILGSDCVACHDVQLEQFHDNHDIFSDQCGNCHFVHNWTDNISNRFETIGDCFYCHNGNTFPGKPEKHMPVSNNCHQCHTLLEWKPVYTFNHDETEAECVVCHPDPTNP